MVVVVVVVVTVVVVGVVGDAGLDRTRSTLCPGDCSQSAGIVRLTSGLVISPGHTVSTVQYSDIVLIWTFLCLYPVSSRS